MDVEDRTYSEGSKVVDYNMDIGAEISLEIVIQDGQSSEFTVSPLKYN